MNAINCKCDFKNNFTVHANSKTETNYKPSQFNDVIFIKFVSHFPEINIMTRCFLVLTLCCIIVLCYPKIRLFGHSL